MFLNTAKRILREFRIQHSFFQQAQRCIQVFNLRLNLEGDVFITTEHIDRTSEFLKLTAHFFRCIVFRVFGHHIGKDRSQAYFRQVVCIEQVTTGYFDG